LLRNIACPPGLHDNQGIVVSALDSKVWGGVDQHGFQGSGVVATLGGLTEDQSHVSVWPPEITGATRTPFSGRLVVDGIKLAKQTFSSRSTGKGEIVIQNDPAAPTPRIILILNGGPDKWRFNINIQPADDSVDSWIWATRLSYCIETGKTFYIQTTDGSSEVLRADEPSGSAKENLAYFAKLVRKLKFIERKFGLKRLSLPALYPGPLLEAIELTFRGITEGQFSSRAEEVVIVGLVPSDVDLQEPPFSRPGSFSYPKKDKIKLFGKELDLGPINIILDKTEIANHRTVEAMRRSPDQPVDLRFVVYDNQITYRFENYVEKTGEKDRQKLEQFKNQLATQEPRELVNLIDESLQAEVSGDEAVEVAMGWLFYHRFRDRYCAQEPTLDADHRRWRVPISLLYADGTGGQVGDITVDAKTGVIISNTPVELIRANGETIARRIFGAE
jgi:hypothetical protein